MKLYRARNKSGTGAWVFADNEQEARTIFFEEGYVRKLENITFIEDQTDFYQGSTDLEQVTVKGIACLGEPFKKWCVSRNGKRCR